MITIMDSAGNVMGPWGGNLAADQGRGRANRGDIMVRIGNLSK